MMIGDATPRAGHARATARAPGRRAEAARCAGLTVPRRSRPARRCARLTSRCAPARSSASPASPATARRNSSKSLAGQRAQAGGKMEVDGEPTMRDAPRKSRAAACASCPRSRCTTPASPRMTVAENMALRAFDRAAGPRGGWCARARHARACARAHRATSTCKTPGPRAPIGTLSGGNVQRAVLARELTERGRPADRLQPLLRARLRGRRRNPLRAS